MFSYGVPPPGDLSSDRSIGLFILTKDSQYNVLGEIIAAWDLSNDMPRMIIMTFVLKCQQTELFGLVCCFFFGSPKSNEHASRFATMPLDWASPLELPINFPRPNNSNIL